MSPEPNFIVIRDSSEKVGWIYPQMLIANLDTGDYTIQGHESKIIIERKRTTGEIAQNINQPRFIRELERLDQFPHPFVVCEFEIHDIYTFPAQSTIPKNRWKFLRTTGPYILKKITEFQLKFRAKWVFAGPHGKEVVTAIFKNYLEMHHESV